MMSEVEEVSGRRTNCQAPGHMQFCRSNQYVNSYERKSAEKEASRLHVGTTWNSSTVRSRT